MTSPFSKEALRDELLQVLTATLDAAMVAHASTLRGATHEEARPENDKDTRALEQTYLARGQAQRVVELEAAIVEVRAMSTGKFAENRSAAVGALVLADDDGEERAYFVAPEGGGEKLSNGHVHVVTPRSPLGRALIGKNVGDEMDVVLPRGKRTLVITHVE
jgi:transcription elongation GreA/GreB family factor